jgi:hypothetical protein
MQLPLLRAGRSVDSARRPLWRRGVPVEPCLRELRVDRYRQHFVTGTSVDSFLFAPTTATPLKIPGIGD